MDKLKEYLTEKFWNHSPNYWTMHSWDYYGYDYGFIMHYDERRELWSLRSLEDSGYSPSQTVLETSDEKVVWRLCECFAPTNINYKTQRK